MVPPEVIDRLRHEKEERDRPALILPLYPPEEIRRDDPCNKLPSGMPNDEDEQTCNGVIVIDLM